MDAGSNRFWDGNPFAGPAMIANLYFAMKIPPRLAQIVSFRIVTTREQGAHSDTAVTESRRGGA